MKPLLKYWPLLRPHLRRFVLALIMGAIAGLASGAGVPYFIQNVFRTVFEETDKVYTMWQLVGIASLLPLAFLLRGLTAYLNQYHMTWCSMAVLRQIRQNVFEKLLVLPLSYYERQRSGDIISRVTADTQQIQQAFIIAARDSVQYIFTALFGVGYLIYLSMQQKEIVFLLLLLAIAPLLIIPVRLIGRHLKHRGRQVQNSVGEITDALAEDLHAVLEIRSFNLQERERSRFRKLLDKHFDFFMKLTKYAKLTQPLMEIIAVTVISASFVYAKREDIGFEVFVAMGTALYFTVDAFKRLARMLNEVQKSQGAFERVESILSEPEVVENPAQPARIDSIRGHVTFENVSFAYAEERALKDVSVDIRPGSVVALVGSSGAGKSTFVKLLPRFYDVTEGRILLDSTDLRDLDLLQLRDAVAIVPQQAILFNDTVANNILAGRAEATREEVIAAARAAHAHEFIEQLPEGYDSQVGENALRLSGGQRQRLALARAFLKKAPLLILDEATSALDSESEAKIQDALESLIKDRTVFLIAHRFATLKLADRILVFDKGHIVGDGTHTELMESSPVYRNLYERQHLA